jgi:two-component system OmpR family response regulator
MRILLVEDDAMLGGAVDTALKDATYAVDWVRDGEAAAEAAACVDYALALLDLGLPERDGLSVLKHFRVARRPLPVIIVTARDAVEIGLLALISERTTIWSNPSRSKNCWRGCALS